MAENTVNEALDCLDSLQQKLAQLNALLAMSYGAAGDTFRNMNDELQDNYLWACSTLASECGALVGGLQALGLKPVNSNTACAGGVAP